MEFPIVRTLVMSWAVLPSLPTNVIQRNSSNATVHVFACPRVGTATVRPIVKIKVMSLRHVARSTVRKDTSSVTMQNVSSTLMSVTDRTIAGMEVTRQQSMHVNLLRNPVQTGNGDVLANM